MINIVDYGSGNLKSISDAFKKLNAHHVVTNDLEELADADAIVLPGVGSFGSAMSNIEIFKDIILEHISDSKPFFGICLGQQVLLTSSEESKKVKGLDIFKGKVEKLPVNLKIPHMGWNNLKIVKNCELLKDISKNSFYFTHSYYTNVEDKEIISATTNYGIDIPAVLHSGNIFTTQFHPEKSGVDGLKILKNFIKLI